MSKSLQAAVKSPLHLACHIKVKGQPNCLKLFKRLFCIRFSIYSINRNLSIHTTYTNLVTKSYGSHRHGKRTGFALIFPGPTLGCVGSPLLRICKETNFTYVQFRNYAVSRGKLSHYDVLGLPTHSTQAQIKNAFFRLSKLYHPDVNDNKEAVSKFHDILEAYEILGNVRKRRMYDEGIQTPDDPRYEHSDSHDNANGFHPRGTFGRQRYQAPPTGRSNIYNFDEFYKQHYGESLRRDKINKDRMEQRKRENDTSKKTTGDTINGMLFATVFFATVGLVLELAERKKLEYERKQQQHKLNKE